MHELSERTKLLRVTRTPSAYNNIITLDYTLIALSTVVMAARTFKGHFDNNCAGLHKFTARYKTKHLLMAHKRTQRRTA